jgi:four helix bundle protein
MEFKCLQRPTVAELAETLTWIDFSFDCHYIEEEIHFQLHQKANEIGAMLGKMIANPEKFNPFTTKLTDR